jgi:ADP-ribose pyrophosphatase
MKVEILSTRRVFDRLFKVDEATLRYERFAGGMSDIVTRLCFERGDSVAAVIVNVDTRHVLLVSQFKYPTFAKGPGWLTEVMAGTIEPGEDARTALAREVLEETGYRLAQAEPIGTFYVTPGGSSERIVLWYAEVRDSDKVAPGGGAAGEHEDIRLIEVPLDDLDAMIDSGSVADAKTLVGLMWLQRRRDRVGKEAGR